MYINKITPYVYFGNLKPITPEEVTQIRVNQLIEKPVPKTEPTLPDMFVKTGK